MKDRKAYITLPADILDKMNSHSARAMAKYYSKGMIGGCSNIAGPNESNNKELVDSVRAKNCSQTELP